jgi:hypothetical protein
MHAFRRPHLQAAITIAGGQASHVDGLLQAVAKAKRAIFGRSGGSFPTRAGSAVKCFLFRQFRSWLNHSVTF